MIFSMLFLLFTFKDPNLAKNLTNLADTPKKSCIRETKHLSTDADSSNDTTIGWTKNTKKPEFLEKRKKSSNTQKLKNF